MNNPVGDKDKVGHVIRMSGMDWAKQMKLKEGMLRVSGDLITENVSGYVELNGEAVRVVDGNIVGEDPWPVEPEVVDRIDAYSEYFTLTDYCDLLERDVTNLRELIQSNKGYTGSDTFGRSISGAVFDFVRKLDSMCNVVGVDFKKALADNIGAYEDAAK